MMRILLGVVTLVLAGVMVTGAQAVSLRVRWTPSAGATSYRIYTSTGLLGTLGPCCDTVFPLTGAAPPSAYLTALNATGESGPSNSVTIAQATPTTTTLPLPTPTTLPPTPTTLPPPTPTTLPPPTPTSTTTSATTRPSTTTSTSLPAPGGTTTTTLPSPPLGGLVAAYGFEEASGGQVLDQSGQGHHGTLSATGVTRQAVGRLGRGVRFDGVAGGKVTIADAPALDLPGSHTLSAWARPSALVSGRWHVLLDKTANGAPTNYFFGFFGRALTYGFLGSTWEEHTATSGLASTGTWTYVAAVFDATVGQVRLYRDGTLLYQAGETARPVVNTTTLLLGMGYPNEQYAGDLDEVRIYNRALTQTEIQRDMTAPVGAGGGGGTSTTTSTSSTTIRTTSTSSTLRSTTTTSTSSTTTTTVMCPSVVPCP